MIEKIQSELTLNIKSFQIIKNFPSKDFDVIIKLEKHTLTFKGHSFKIIENKK